MFTRDVSKIFGAIAVTIALVWSGVSKAEGVRVMTPKQAQSLLQSGADVTVLDIRTPREFRAGHISGAKNINFYSKSFRAMLAKLDRNATYLMHCRRGVRSGGSLKVFRALGFTNIVHMPAGIVGWKRARLPLTK